MENEKALISQSVWWPRILLLNLAVVCLVYQQQHALYVYQQAEASSLPSTWTAPNVESSQPTIAKSSLTDRTSTIQHHNVSQPGLLGIQPILGTNISWRSAGNQDDTACYLDSNWKFVGNGANHFAYTSQLACPNTATRGGILSNAQEHPLQPESRYHHQQVLVRFFTIVKAEVLTPGKKRTRLFASFKEDLVKKGQIIQDVLGGGGWTLVDVDTYFSIARGHVDIPSSFFDFNRTTGADHKPVWGRIAGVHGDVVRAELYYSAGHTVNRYLGKKKSVLVDEQRVSILQQVVLIYYHMYRQRIIHCDMHTGHLYVEHQDNNQVQLRMIDFERVQFLDTPKKELVLARRQLWQLLLAMARICSKRKKALDEIEMPSQICHNNGIQSDPDAFEQLVRSELQDCPILPRVPWERDWLGKNVTVTYLALLDWVGIRNHTLIQKEDHYH